MIKWIVLAVFAVVGATFAIAKFLKHGEDDDGGSVKLQWMRNRREVKNQAS